ncbi:hypothetical protein GCM10010439_29150 [Actinocorallia aurantiaca]|uniref:Uncharacterized protein n=1 Tax=Actinocorallia aurantiaca TaxID=46204 RepID=A0ABP6GMM6_9ACTN
MKTTPAQPDLWLGRSGLYGVERDAEALRDRKEALTGTGPADRRPQGGATGGRWTSGGRPFPSPVIGVTSVILGRISHARPTKSWPSGQYTTECLPGGHMR